AAPGDAEAVGDPDIVGLRTEGDQQVEAGEGGRARARGDDLRLPDVLIRKLQPVEHGGRHDDCGSVLVVVEDGDLHALLEAFLHLEALGRLDVLQVDAAEGGLERGDGLDHAAYVGRIDLHVEDVDAGEL